MTLERDRRITVSRSVIVRRRSWCACRKKRVREVVWAVALASLVIPAAALGQTSQTIVLWTANVPASNVHGNWQSVSDVSAAGGSALATADHGEPKVSPALATPASYFEISFVASAHVPYHLWVRVRAQNNSTANDSIYVQFSDSVDATDTPVARIGSTDAATVILQDGANG